MRVYVYNVFVWQERMVKLDDVGFAECHTALFCSHAIEPSVTGCKHIIMSLSRVLTVIDVFASQVNKFNKTADRAVCFTDKFIYKLDPKKGFKAMKKGTSISSVSEQLYRC